MLACASSYLIRLSVCSSPLVHISTAWCFLLSDIQVKKITFRAAQEGLVPFLQDHYCVLHVAVYEVDPYGAPDFGTLQSPSHWAWNVSFCLREGYPIRPGSIQGGGGGGAFLDLPIPPHSGHTNGSPGTHQSGPHSTQGIRRAARVSPSKLGPLPS